jgi:hypothetical protein
VSLAKISFAVLYLRLFPARKLMLLNYCVMAVIFAQVVTETCMPLFRCSPIALAWDPDLNGSCSDIGDLWYVSTGLNIVEALVLFIQPIPAVWKLKLPISKRLGIIFMLSLGLL